MSLNIEPKKVFDFFYEINQIPRCSGDEKRISDFLVKFAKDRDLEVEQDETLNVIIRKKASKGYENSEPIIIQGHMDMVCVKNKQTNHDFNKDPIDMYIEDGFIKANGTTLGADDGIAVAFALAILDGEYNHPALEVLITTSEETGMFGAAAIKEDMLKGKKLINIDSEDEGIFLVSCAGGSNIQTTFNIKRENFDGKGIKIKVSNLQGGHSGSEIIRQRANSNKLIFRIVNEIRKVTDVRIIHAEGGTKHNAIPNESTIDIAVKDEKKSEIIIEKMTKILKNEYIIEEKAMNISRERISYEKTFDKDTTDKIIDYFNIIPDGVISMSKDIENLVQTSLNNAVIINRENELKLTTSIRSSVESELDMMLDKMEIIAKALGAKTERMSRYPAWQYEQDSILREICEETFEKMFSKKVKIEAIHAGLECGLLKNVLKDCLMISYGPDIFDAHTPRERLSISSTKRMWEYTLKLLENLK